MVCDTGLRFIAVGVSPSMKSVSLFVRKKTDFRRKMSEFHIDTISPILWSKVGDDLSEYFDQKN